MDEKRKADHCGAATSRAIPQSDPLASYLAHKDEIDEAISRVLGSGRYILAAEVSAFEHEFAGFVGARHCVGVGTGTDALILALKALGVAQGDCVITVSHTAVATVAAIESAGAIPILLDVDAATFTLALDDLEALLDQTSCPVRAIVPVHLYGCPAAMLQIAAIARRYDIPVVEDASQAHGAAIGERKVGLFGDLGAFSMYPTKNLGAFGDAGAIVTNDDTLAKRLRGLRQYGWTDDRFSDFPGMNSRLDELQAAVLRVKLRYLDADNARRRAIAHAYDVALRQLPLVRPAERPGETHAFHQYVVRIPERERVRIHLREHGIATALHYPAPVHLQNAYRRLPIGPSRLVNTERISAEILSLPIYPQMKDWMVAEVVDSLSEALCGSSEGQGSI